MTDGKEGNMNPREEGKSTSTGTGTRREFLRRAGAAALGAAAGLILPDSLKNTRGDVPDAPLPV